MGNNAVCIITHTKFCDSSWMDKKFLVELCALTWPFFLNMGNAVSSMNMGLLGRVDRAESGQTGQS